MLEVELVSEEHRFDTLREEWNDLWKESASRSAFSSYNWTRCCWQELRHENDLRIVVVRDHGAAILIAPFMKSRRNLRGLPVICLTFIEHPENQTADFLARSSDREGRGMRECFRYLQNSVRGWHLLSLDKIAATSPTVQLLRGMSMGSGSKWDLRSSHKAYYIPLSGSWETYLASRSSRFRKTLRNIINRVDRLGNVSVKSYATTTLNAKVLEQIFAISEASWKLGDGIAMTSQRLQFFTELIANSTGEPKVEVWVLEFDGAPVASEIQVFDGRTVYALKSDYDERYAEYSPGVYLQHAILKRLFECREEVYNFGVGLNPYKSRWTDLSTTLVKGCVYNRTVYSHIVRAVNSYDLPKRSWLSGIKSANAGVRDAV